MQTFGANKKGSVFVYITMSLLIAASGSLFNPVLSYFFNTELGLSPIYISILFILLPIGTILVVQTVARFSDMGLQRPTIICISALFGIASSIILILRPSFLVLCTIGLICLSSYPVSFPQIFASAREYAEKHLNGAIMFTTVMRAMTSLSWVVGPPLAFGIAFGASFNALFITSATMFILVGLTSFFFLPNVMERKKTAEEARIKWWTNRSVMLLCVANAMISTAFSSYITTMPLFLTQELHMAKELPSYIMGLAAFLEIPLMFVAARLAKYIGLKAVVILGSAALCIFLILFCFVRSFELIMCIQLFSATFIAFVSTMGMVFFQELLPTIPGQSTSLFINSSTAGQIAGGAMISLAAGGTYLLIYEVGLGIAVVGTILLFFVSKPPKIS